MKNICSLGSITGLGTRKSGQTVNNYSLNDRFITDVSAGSVNNTTAEPLGGVRTVTDSAGTPQLSISGGQLVKASGTNVAQGDPGIWYAGVTRVAGKMFIGTHVTGNFLNYDFGWDANTSGGISSYINFNSATVIRVGDGTIAAVAVGSPAGGGALFYLAVIMRATGYYYFIKEATIFPNWTLIWIATNGTTTPMYPSIGVHGTGSNAFTFDNLRIPTRLWLPSPTVSDSFNRSNGALGTTDGAGHAESTGLGSGGAGLAWTGSTWTIATNAAVNTPTLATTGGPLNDGELLTDPSLEVWTDANTPTNWNPAHAGTSSVNQDTDKHSGTYAVKLITDAGGADTTINQNFTTVIGKWYRLSWWTKSDTTNKGYRVTSFGTTISPSSATGYIQQFASGLATNTTSNILLGRQTSSMTSMNLWFDDISAKQLTTSELFASVSSGKSDYIADVKFTWTTGTSGYQSGMVLNLDSTSNPQNFLVAFINTFGARTANLYKCVGGTYTPVISATVTYSAGAVLRVIKDSYNVTLYYNNLIVGSTTALVNPTDDTVKNGTLHGLFTTAGTDSLDDFIIRPRGTSGEYNVLNSF